MNANNSPRVSADTLQETAMPTPPSRAPEHLEQGDGPAGHSLAPLGSTHMLSASPSEPALGPAEQLDLFPEHVEPAPRSLLPPRLTAQELVEESGHWLKLIQAPEVPLDEHRWITNETVDNFRFYYNRSYTEHKKASASEIIRTAIEWTGEGSILRDLEGREIIDCLGGYGIYSAGIRHPKIVATVKAQLERMPLSSQELLDPLRGALARLLGELAPGELQYSFFINNGTDAVDGAMKLARLYTGRTGFISSIGGFHGKSLGALSCMGKSKFRQPFEPLLPEVYFVPFGDADAVEEELWKARTVGKDIAGIIMEPIQGENGAVVPPDDFWPRLRELSNQYGCLLIADEVQTGLGRTGKLFGVEHWNVEPDIMCLGKALGGGVMPLSAFMSTPKIWQKLNDNPVLHTSTFGGNPLACAAGIAALHVTLDEDLPGQAASKGVWLIEQLQQLQAEFPELVQEVRGRGLLIGLVMATQELGWEFCTELYDLGVLVAGTLTNAKTIRYEPALNIPWALLEKAVVATRTALSHVRENNPGLPVLSRVPEASASRPRRVKRSPVMAG
ncbi:MAG: aminotransferase class III-fold pyridoxal phosphate-dependent enzyme [Myxococcota bacterium]